MAKGKRMQIVALARLTWAPEDADVQTFVQTGKLGDPEDDVIPYNPDIRSEVVKQFQGG
jgi:hypothetical protein